MRIIKTICLSTQSLTSRTSNVNNYKYFLTFILNKHELSLIQLQITEVVLTLIYHSVNGSRLPLH